MRILSILLLSVTFAIGIVTTVVAVLATMENLVSIFVAGMMFTLTALVMDILEKEMKEPQ